MRRRAGAVAGALATVAVLAGGVAARGLVGAGGAAGAQEPPDAEQAGSGDLGTAAVVRTDLRTTTELDGTLGYGDTREIPNVAQGTLTWAPAEGTVLTPGAVAYEVDERPVVVLRGDTPAWRTMARNVDDGTDVAQLQQFLLDAGYADPEDVTADGDFDWATEQAVEAWQDALGVDDTGVVELGSVVFLGADVRVATTPQGVGAPVGSSVLTVSSTTQAVTVDLDAADASQLPVGTEVEVELPDGSTVPATVAAVSTTAEAGEDGQDGSSGATTVQVTLALGAPVPAYVEAPVDVVVTTSEVTDVLAVPVSALLALAEGGYAVQVVDEAGAPRLVAVQPGEFADGLVEVVGELAEGDTVVVPA